MQLEAIASHPNASYLGEETNNSCLTSTSFQVAVESNKVSPQPPLLQTKQPQFPQPPLIRLVLQTPHQPHCPSLDTLQQLNVFLVVRGPKPNTVHTAGCRPTPCFPPGGSPATPPQACSVAWGCCDRSTGPGIWPCWNSYSWAWPLDPVCPDFYLYHKLHRIIT